MKDSLKKTIDEMTYAEMLKENRFAPLGSELFMGETGLYFAEVMSEKENELADGERKLICKTIGWEK
jgi:hypothetical protein